MRVTLSPRVQIFGSGAARGDQPVTTGSPLAPLIPEAESIAADAALAPFFALDLHDAEHDTAPDPNAAFDPGLESWLAPLDVQDPLDQADVPFALHEPELDDGAVQGADQVLDELFGLPETRAADVPLGMALRQCQGTRKNDPLCATFAPLTGHSPNAPPLFDRTVLQRRAQHALAHAKAPTTSAAMTLRVVIEAESAEVCGLAPSGSVELRFDPRFGNGDPVCIAIDRESAERLALGILGLGSNAAVGAEPGDVDLTDATLQTGEYRVGPGAPDAE